MNKSSALYKRLKKQAKRKFSVYPSMYANMWLSKKYKSLSKRKRASKSRKRSKRSKRKSRH